MRSPSSIRGSTVGLRDDIGYRVIQQLNGIGRVHAAALVAEIGDVTRFPARQAAVLMGGLTPHVRESDTTSHHGSITKGSRLIEAVARYHGDTPIRDTYRRVADRRGTNIARVARVAAARKLLTLVYDGLRDHEIRCLHTRDDAVEEAA